MMKIFGSSENLQFNIVGRCLGAAVSNKIKFNIVGATIGRPRTCNARPYGFAKK